jgi:hypothetical protein
LRFFLFFEKIGKKQKWMQSNGVRLRFNRQRGAQGAAPFQNQKTRRHRRKEAPELPMTTIEFTALVRQYQGLVYTVCRQLVPTLVLAAGLIALGVWLVRGAHPAPEPPAEEATLYIPPQGASEDAPATMPADATAPDNRPEMPPEIAPEMPDKKPE